MFLQVEGNRYINSKDVVLAYRQPNYAAIKTFGETGPSGGTVQSTSWDLLNILVQRNGWVETAPGEFINLNAVDEVYFSSTDAGEVAEFRIGTRIVHKVGYAEFVERIKRMLIAGW